MFAVAIGTVLFPRLSRLAATDRLGEFRVTMNTGLRQIFFVTLPFTAFFAILGEPTVRLIFERGMVTASDTQQVAWALTFFSLGMAFVSANTLLNRGFYGIQKTWVPLIVGVANLALNALLNYLLYRPLGVGGITLATSLVSTFNFFALIVLLGRNVGSLQAGRLLGGVAKSIVCLVPLSVLGFGSWWLIDQELGRSVWAQLLSVGMGYTLGFAAYAGTAKLLRMKEIDELIGAIRRHRDREVTASEAAPEGGASPGPSVDD
jgi:putative peptidoglycan lipid II flippase